MVEPQTEFRKLDLQSDLLAVLDRVGYFQPTPIQEQLIPQALSGRDVIGQAQTGTGKTAAFVLPFLHHWQEESPAGPLALILAPTRELVVQVAEETKKLTPHKRCRTVALYGGQKLNRQFRELKAGCSLVVGSPGRVLDHIRRGTLSLQAIRYVVLDEADRMLDIGFRPDIEKILRKCPSDRQTLLMSATMPESVLRLVHRYMVDPTHINLSPTTLTVDRIQQLYFTVDEDRKFDLLVRVLARERPRQCIIFCQRKRGADRLHRDLSKVYRGVGAIHGDLQQTHRDRIMAGYRAGKIRCLIATDVVSRGIDVSGVSHIINYDLPDDIENYVHRIGRTGRMGKDGVAVSFVLPSQGRLLTTIEMSINHLLERDIIPGFQPVDSQPVIDSDASVEPAKPIFGRPRKRYSSRI